MKPCSVVGCVALRRRGSEFCAIHARDFIARETHALQHPCPDCEGGQLWNGYNDYESCRRCRGTGVVADTRAAVVRNAGSAA